MHARKTLKCKCNVRAHNSNRRACALLKLQKAPLVPLCACKLNPRSRGPSLAPFTRERGTFHSIMQIRGHESEIIIFLSADGKCNENPSMDWLARVYRLFNACVCALMFHLWGARVDFRNQMWPSCRKSVLSRL